MSKASGAPLPGGFIKRVPGGAHAPAPGGISFVGVGKWRAFTGHKSADFSGPISSSGARVAQTRSVANLRSEAGTTSVTISWTLFSVPGGSTATVSGGSTATASFTPDVAGTYVLRCTVTFVGANAPNTIVQDHTYISA